MSSEENSVKATAREREGEREREREREGEGPIFGALLVNGSSGSPPSLPERSERGLSKRPMVNLTRRIRRTASSMRLMGMNLNRFLRSKRLNIIEIFRSNILVLEEAGDQLPVGVHLLAIPARVGDHDRGDPLDDCAVVAGHVDPKESTLVNDGVVLVDPAGRPPSPTKERERERELPGDTEADVVGEDGGLEDVLWPDRTASMP
ncbi:unnamed protein product [Spirodela intermedia]|uniref:Uncharacterized protein n=1 Tax=Spirodela intermedia TaxID=51605 RepID=A0A7I8JAF8_SPIIN|nr:unnamed protein product [Spirodela intermedia]CAA6667137.1 unnamed protein product [Spirodela intermedia]